MVPSALSSSPPAPSSALVSFGFRRDLDEMVSQGSILGAGTYGVVRCATLLPGAFLPGLPPGAAPPSPDSGPLLAVKRVPKHLPRVSGAVLESYRNKIRSEAATHSRLSASLSVVTLYGCFEDEQAVYFLMQRCTGGSLWACPELRPGGGGGADNDDGAGAAAGGPSEAGVAAVLRHVLRALSQCHAAGVCFRDVKPDAFLRASDDPHSPLLLSDFGLAARVPPAGVLTERCGTAAYCAPEVLVRGRRATSSPLFHEAALSSPLFP